MTQSMFAKFSLFFVLLFHLSKI